MERRTKLVALSLLVVILLLLAAFLFKLPRKQEARRAVPPGRKAAVPPSSATEIRSAVGIPTRQEAFRQTLWCLNALCDTGASDDTLTETRSLVANLDATPQPLAKRLSSVLKSVLLCLKNGSSAEDARALVSFSGIPRDLIDRAAAACDARGCRKPGEIVLSFAGDCTFGTVNGDGGAGRFPSVYRRAGRADYSFALVRPWFLNDDLTVVNFECTLTTAARTADKQWHFKGPARYASIFPAGSVEAVGLANNHSHDYLQAGFDDTVTNFKNAHVPDFYQNVPYVTTLQGVPTVIIGDCTVVGENTTKLEGVSDRVLGEIKRYKRRGNIVVVFMHWGSELDTVPRPWQQAMGRSFIDAGADAVVGAHPHIVQGIELYKGKYIAYSLGNFAFGGNSLARFPETFLLRLRFRTEGGRMSVAGASVVPCWITSGQARNEAGILRNDYQPKPVFGRTAAQTVALVLRRSAGLKYGVKKIEYPRLRERGPESGGARGAT